jgi:hypothetical protein
LIRCADRRGAQGALEKTSPAVARSVGVEVGKAIASDLTSRLLELLASPNMYAGECGGMLLPGGPLVCANMATGSSDEGTGGPSGGNESLAEEVLAALSGNLTIDGEGFSASEKAVAQYPARHGNDVVLREATGVERTSDLLVNGTPYDVYTPEAGTSVRNVLSNVASKWTQVHGGGVVVDLSNTDLGASDFGDNALARVNGFVNSWGGTPLSEVSFYGGGG